MIRVAWIFAFFSILSAAEPTALYLTFSDSPESSMTVNWITDAKEGESLSFHLLGEASARTGSSRVFSLPDGKYLHRSELTGLLPGELYEFQLEDHDQKYTFRTVPQDVKEPLNFVVAGDLFPGSIETFATTCRVAAKTNPYFVVVGGDLAYTASSSKNGKESFDRWIDFFKTWNREMVTPEGHLIPIFAAIGNHEVNGGFRKTPDHAPGFYTFFRGQGQRSYQMVKLGDYLSLILLDSDHTCLIEGPQTEWLEDALKQSASCQRSFVVYHIPAYPCVRRWTQGESQKIRKYWTPLFDRYNVTMVFENHDHAYKRTHPLRNQKVDPCGIIYLGDGGFGTGLVRPKRADKRYYLAKTKCTRHFLNVCLYQDRTAVYAIDDSGKTFDFILK